MNEGTNESSVNDSKDSDNQEFHLPEQTIDDDIQDMNEPKYGSYVNEDGLRRSRRN